MHFKDKSVYLYTRVTISPIENFKMKKQGHPLKELVPVFPQELLESLRDEFSISTAEELVSLAAGSGERMKAHLHVPNTLWSRVIRAARAIFSEEELHSLETPAIEKFPKGAILGKRATRDEDLEKYITHE